MRGRVFAIVSMAIGMITIGCGYFKGGGVRVEVRRDGTSYLFLFANCLGSPIGVRGIRVADVDLRESTASDMHYNDASYCDVQLPMSKPLRGSWRYGSTPPNGLVTKCLPLKPGTYLADVRGGEVGGYRDFRIESDGSIKLGKGTCD
jgi:hypothetical protein